MQKSRPELTILSLRRAIKEANECLLSGEGVDITYYMRGVADAECLAVIKYVLGLDDD